MSGKDDMISKASMFTMNGMPDPRLFAERPESQEAFNFERSFYAGLLKSIRSVVDAISRRALREKNAH